MKRQESLDDKSDRFLRRSRCYSALTNTTATKEISPPMSVTLLWEMLNRARYWAQGDIDPSEPELQGKLREAIVEGQRRLDARVNRLFAGRITNHLGF